MDMVNWAENEVKIACEKVHQDSQKEVWDYSCACYQSALKAYKSLAEDGHSGFSWVMTANILKRLMDDKPLTPIENTEDIWVKGRELKYDDHIAKQCTRMPSLFKCIYNDGRIEYHDNNQFICVDIHDGRTYLLKLIRDVMQEKFPIVFPYMPGNSIKVYCEDFLTDFKNGDFDTVGIIYCQTNNGKEDIKRYFKESSNNSSWEEISFDEYMKRKLIADKLKESRDE